MASIVPLLPDPITIDGRNHIPPPSVSSFDNAFGFSGLLPPGTSLPSSWGTTRYYEFKPDSKAQSSSSRRILCVHGGGTPAIGLAPLARLLSDAGNHVVIHDLWGHGLSSTPLLAHTPALMHAQIHELLFHLGWSRNVNLVGFSMGGAIAATFAAIHGHILESVVLIAPAGLFNTSDSMWSESLRTDEVGSKTVMEYVTGDPEAEPAPGWKEKMKNSEIDTIPFKRWQRKEHRGNAASIVSLWHHVVFDHQTAFKELGKKDVRVLVILGDSDEVIGLEQTLIELRAVGWEGDIQVLVGATHELVRVHREEVADRCIGFWGKP